MRQVIGKFTQVVIRAPCAPAGDSSKSKIGFQYVAPIREYDFAQHESFIFGWYSAVPVVDKWICRQSARRTLAKGRRICIANDKQDSSKY
jgi:hypothetical protein